MGATNPFDLTSLRPTPTAVSLERIASGHCLPTGVSLDDFAPRVDVDGPLTEFLASLLRRLAVLRTGQGAYGSLESLLGRPSPARIRVLDPSRSGIAGDISDLSDTRLEELNLSFCRFVGQERKRAEAPPARAVREAFWALSPHAFNLCSTQAT